MRRALALTAAACAVLPVALVAAMLVQVPPSALTVPGVHIAAAGASVDLSPQSLGVRRTAEGLDVRPGTLDRALEDLSRKLSRAPVPGRYEKTDAGIVLNRGVPGVRIDVPRARVLLLDAMRAGAGDVTLPVVHDAAPIDQRYAIVVRLTEFHLDLYEGTSLRRSYPVGVGALRFPTPPGEYRIRSKAKSPTWVNPGSAWARGMPRSVAPGPRNPLGSRALRLDREALVIHGTPQPSSVGRRTSHGCMRMLKADVEELFEIVPVGTPVFIVP